MKNAKATLTVATLILLAHVILGGAIARAQSKSGGEQNWDAVVAAAKKEGKVVVLGPPGDRVREALVQGFGKAFPDIPIEFSGARGGELATRVKAERDAGIYSVDVVINGTSTANAYFKPMNSLDPIEPALILPEVTDPKNWRDNRLEFSDKTRLNLVFTTQTNVPVIFNSAQVKAEQVDELGEILDPKWKGKIALQDPIPSGSGNGVFRWLWAVLGPEKTMDVYRKLRAHAAVVDRDQRRQIEWVAQGKYPINIGPGTVMYQLQQRGLKFGTIAEFKDLGGYVTPGFGSLMYINRAPHPNAGKVFLNWLLSKEGQMAFTQAMGYASRRKDVPKDHVPDYWIPKEGSKYWPGYLEEHATMSPEQEKFLKEVFSR
ncbi:MAG: extracellular solute-binding protein [Deltaproteobacteria bacterium]|nr:extracellular solute-binding protein [Deltaproteobacteria bacterium]